MSRVVFVLKEVIEVGKINFIVIVNIYQYVFCNVMVQQSNIDEQFSYWDYVGGNKGLVRCYIVLCQSVFVINMVIV